jgi:Domain of unknown function (DUF6285)
MQDAPNKETLLLAVAKFLISEVRPAVKDSRLSFRLLIAANLAAICAQESSGEDVQNAAERARLAKIFSAGGDHEEQVPGEPLPHALEIAAITKGNALLAKGIRDGALDIAPRSAVFDHVKRTLKEKLAIDNPRFDVEKDLP